jgi:EmrB/QacA subfamily drug resistance transporter
MSVTSAEVGTSLNGSHPTLAPAPGPGPDAHRRWFGLVVIALSQLMIVVDATIINVALPAMTTTLKISADDRQWVVTVYTLTFGGLLLIGGRVADYLGLRKAFVIGLLGFGIASAFGGAAQNLAMLLSARAAQGLFGALLAPAALALLANTFSDARERAKAFAIFGAVAGGGSAVGLVLGGVLTEYASWRWTMFINIPIAAITVAGAYLLLDEHRGEHPGRLDVLGTVLATSGLLSVVYSFSEAERNGWGRPRTLGVLGLGLALLALFIGSQRMVANPVLPLRLLADRTRGGANVAIGLASTAMFGVFFVLTFFMQGVLGYSPVKTGVGFLAITGGIIVSSGVVSAIGHKVPPRLILGVGLLGAAVGAQLLTRISMTSTYTANLLPPLILVGLSLGCVFVPSFNAATIGVAPRDASVASAIINTSQQVGGSLGVALLSTVGANHAKDWLAQHGVNPMNLLQAQVVGSTAASRWAAVILLVAAVATAALVNIKRLDLSMTGEMVLPVVAESPLGVVEPFGVEPVFVATGSTDHVVPPAVVAEVSEKLADVPTQPRRSSDGDPAGWAASGAPGANPIIGSGDERAHPSVPGRGPVEPVTAAARPMGGPPSVVAVGGSFDGQAVVRDAAGSPVAGAVWTVLDTAGRQLGHGRSDGSGVFGFAAIGQTDVVLVVRHPGHRPYACAVHLGDDSAGVGGLQVDVTLVSGMAVSGVVRGPDGHGIPGARVWLADAGGNVVVRTSCDGAGRYAFADVPAGSYRLVATGYRAGGHDLTVSQGQDVATELTLVHADPADVPA